MRSFTKVLAILLDIALAGLGVFLATWVLPAPSQSVEKVQIDDRFPR